MEVFLLIFAAILAVAFFAAWPKAGLYALAFFLPVIGWNIYLKGSELPLVDLIGLLAFSGYAVRILLSVFSRKPEAPIRFPLLFPFALFLGISIVSAVFSQSPAFSLYYIVRWPLFMYAVYVFLPYNLVDDSRTLKAAVSWLIAGAGAVLLSGFLSLYGQDWHDSFYRLKSLPIWGIYPFGENHNLIAEYLNVAAFLILMRRALTKNLRWRRAWDILFVLTALGIVLTFSRAGWITLALQSAAYIFYTLRTKKKAIADILLGVAILAIVLTPLAWRMSVLQADNTSSTENRWLLTEIAWQSFEQSPYLGWGSGQFVNLVGGNLRFTAKYGDPIDSHGMLQKVLAENGAFGLAAWLFLVFAIIIYFFRALRRYPSSRYWLLPLILSGLGGLFFQLFNTSYYKGKVWLPLALGLAAIRLLEEKETKNKNDAR